MKKQLSNVHKLIISLFLSVVVLFAVGFVLKHFFGEHTAAVKAQNEQLKTEYDNLQVFVAKMDSYKSDAAKYIEETESIINSYPANTDIKIDTYNFEKWWQDKNIQMFTSDISVNPELEEVSAFTLNGKDYVCKKTSISVSYSIPYDNFKNFVKNLDMYDSGMNITEVTMSADEQDGKVIGSINFTKNIVEGSTLVVTMPNLDIESGTNGVFFGGLATPNPSIMVNDVEDVDSDEDADTDTDDDFDVDVDIDNQNVTTDDTELPNEPDNTDDSQSENVEENTEDNQSNDDSE